MPGIEDFVTAASGAYVLDGSVTTEGWVVVTDPALDPTSFDFVLDGGTLGSPVNLDLTDTDDPFIQGVAPGAGFSVTETAVPGWGTTVVCTNDRRCTTQRCTIPRRVNGHSLFPRIPFHGPALVHWTLRRLLQEGDSQVAADFPGELVDYF